jgi:branched-chain amino acid transport system ATP-binding protein
MNINRELILSIQNVSKHFGGLKAVNDVSIDVAYGERRLFLGTNGAGKTTLFNLIAGDLPVTSGKIIMFSRDVTKLTVRKRVKLGMRRTYQTSALFNSLTVRANLYLALLGEESLANHLNPLKSVKRDKALNDCAYQMACQVRLEEKIETEVLQLSHGERRQLEFGMALINNPKLLMFDEPCSGLSQSERQTMLGLIKSLDPSITVILIEHDMDIAFEIADYITVMYDGKLLIQGTPEEIKQNETVKQIYLGGSANV